MDLGGGCQDGEAARIERHSQKSERPKQRRFVGSNARRSQPSTSQAANPSDVSLLALDLGQKASRRRRGGVVQRDELDAEEWLKAGQGRSLRPRTGPKKERRISHASTSCFMLGTPHFFTQRP
jgi:hypothetical protein